MPAGTYEFIAHTHELQYPGLADAAGNYLDDTSVPGEGTKDFIVNFAIQTTPVYITGMAMESSYSVQRLDGHRRPAVVLRAAADHGRRTPATTSPPRRRPFVIDLSNPIPFGNYTPDVLLVRSADTADRGGRRRFRHPRPGRPGRDRHRLHDRARTRRSPSTTTTPTTGHLDPGRRPAARATAWSSRSPPAPRCPPTITASTCPTRSSPAATTPGSSTSTATSSTASSWATRPRRPAPTSPISPRHHRRSTRTSCPTAPYRLNDMSGDGVAGGAFMTGFTVVPYGNVVYARPDYVENPLLPNSAGSPTAAWPTLPGPRPRGRSRPRRSRQSRPTTPTGGLNYPTFFQPGNFNPAYDFSGDGKFEQSAFYAASQLRLQRPGRRRRRARPAVAQPDHRSRSTQASFSLVAPAGNTPAPGGSASVPYNTTLVFQAGSTLKLQSASLFVQNQGSALKPRAPRRTR